MNFYIFVKIIKAAVISKVNPIKFDKKKKQQIFSQRLLSKYIRRDQ